MKDFQLYALLFLGGGAGSLGRMLFAKWLNPVLPHLFLGTLAANVLASFLLGVFVALFSEGREAVKWYVLLATGFCGGFSTFSTFAWEGVHLLRSGKIENFLGYFALSLVIGLLAAAAGYNLVR